ncbi:GspE/PulE family protein [Peptostreptococcus anaerobius]
MDKILSTIIPETYARKNLVFPKEIDNDRIVVLMENYDLEKISDIKKFSKRKVDVVKSSKTQIKKLIDDNYSLDTNEINDEVNILMNSILENAIKMGASDIHIEPNSREVRLRYRVNGDLILIDRMVLDDMPKIATLIKLKALCDITEKRLPQDGRFRYEEGTYKVDIRLSTLPTVYGEKLVLRLLDHNKFIKTKEELGFSKNAIKKIDSIIKRQCGILIVAGATGSGKSSTVYSLLNGLRGQSINITTIEDPVEYKLDGINQIQVNNKAGLRFDTGLKSILRQDPDIIVLGEIRDKETADLAIRSAITGHFVITTLHTNDAISTISRLKDMGIEPYMINAGLIGVIAQRLVKKKLIYNGYEGEERTLIYEIVEIGQKIKDGIKAGYDDISLRKIAIENGMITYEDSIKEKNK